MSVERDALRQIIQLAKGGLSDRVLCRSIVSAAEAALGSAATPEPKPEPKPEPGPEPKPTSAPAKTETETAEPRRRFGNPFS